MSSLQTANETQTSTCVSRERFSKVRSESNRCARPGRFAANSWHGAIPSAARASMLNMRMLGDFRFSERFASNLDWDAWERICRRRGWLAYVRAPLVSHRVHVDSQTSVALANEVRKREDLAMFRRFWPASLSWLISIAYRRGYVGNQV